MTSSRTCIPTSQTMAGSLRSREGPKISLMPNMRKQDSKALVPAKENTTARDTATGRPTPMDSSGSTPWVAWTPRRVASTSCFSLVPPAECATKQLLLSFLSSSRLSSSSP